MEDTLYLFGSSIKAVDGKVKGYAIRFGNPSDTDLESDYFTSNTDFGRPLKIGDSFKMNLYWHHGQDKTLKSYVIGSGIATLDDKGLWFESQLDMANEYAKYIDELAKQGKLGYSSGSASHLVSREKKGMSFEIKSWPIAEISLTPTPAESRNMVAKSLNDFVKEYYNEEGQYVPKKPEEKEYDEEVEDMVEGLIELEVAPEGVADTVFDGYEKDLVSDAVHYLFERMCSGLYAVLEEGKDISYVYALLDGFTSRAKVAVEKLYDSVEAEMAMLKMLSGQKPESIRDLEKRLRDVGYSNNQSKMLAGVVWSHLREVDDMPAKSMEMLSNEQEDNIKQTLLKRAMLDLL